MESKEKWEITFCGMVIAFSVRRTGRKDFCEFLVGSDGQLTWSPQWHWAHLQCVGLWLCLLLMFMKQFVKNMIQSWTNQDILCFCKDSAVVCNMVIICNFKAVVYIYFKFHLLYKKQTNAVMLICRKGSGEKAFESVVKCIKYPKGAVSLILFYCCCCFKVSFRQCMK